MLVFGISRLNKPKIKRRSKIMNNFDLELKTIQLQNEKLLRELEEVKKNWRQYSHKLKTPKNSII